MKNPHPGYKRTAWKRARKPRDPNACPLTCEICAEERRWHATLSA